MSIRIFALATLFFVVALSGPTMPSLAAEAKGHLTEREALTLLRQTIQNDSLYESWIRIDCLQYWTDSSNETHFDFAVREKHGGICTGDPLTNPVIDRFCIMRGTKALLWYDLTNDVFISYDPQKIIRK